MFFFQQLSRRHEQGSGTVPCEPDPHECSVLQALRQVSPQSSKVFMSVKDPLECIARSNSRQRLQNRTDHLSQMEQTKLFRYAGSKSNDFFEVGQVWQTKFSLNKSK